MKQIISMIMLGLVLAVPTQAVQGQTITEIVASSGGEFDNNFLDYDILLNAVVTANLADTLNDPDLNVTVFAPNDFAFILTARDLGYDGFSEEGAWNFLVGAFTELSDDGNPVTLLTQVLLYHVSPDNLPLRRVVFSRRVHTLQGSIIRPRFFRLRDNDRHIPDPFLFFPFTNINADNGRIHTITRVLIPINLP